MINNFLIEVVSWIYSGIAALYNIFLYLAKLNIFSSEDNVLAPIIRRMYTVIGVVMLFFLAYSMLRTIVNPDAKDKNGTGKIILDVIKAIIVIAIVPTAFEFAFVVQDSLLEKNTIGKIILGTNDSNSTNEYLVSQTGDQQTVSEVIEEAGIDISITIFESFFYPYVVEDGKTNETIQAEIENFNYGGRKYQEIHDMVVADGNFNHYKLYADIINEETRNDGYIVYNWVFALVAGGFCIYMMISYCLSLALRLVKLAFYEIIAPLPAMADIIPGKKDMLKKWIKVTLTTFFEALLRIAILFLMVYLIRVICVVFNKGVIDEGAGFFTTRILRALLIMGCLMFAKQAPQLISEITGIDSKNMSMGIKEKLAAGGAFIGGAMAGGALTSGIRNAVGGFTNNSYRNKVKEKLNSDSPILYSKGEQRRMRVGGIAAGLGEGLLRGAAGFVSGGVRSFGKDTNDVKGMREHARKGATKAGEKAVERKGYKASHGGTVWGSISGHAKDTVRRVGDYFGINSVEDAKAELADLEKMGSAKKGTRTAAEGLITKELSKASSSLGITCVVDMTAQRKELESIVETLKASGRSDSDAEIQSLNRLIEKINTSGNIKTLDVNDLRATKTQMEAAQAGGRSEEYAYLQKQFANDQKLLQDAIQNQALVSDDEWDRFIKVNKSLAGDLGDIRQSAVEFKNLLEKNIASPAVQAAGFTLDGVKASITVNSDEFKAFGTESDLRKTELKAAITKFERERQDSEKKK